LYKVNVPIISDDHHDISDPVSKMPSPPSTMKALIIVAAFVAFAHADWQYRSRPDLAPPRLNITIPPTADISPGYLFVAPFAGLFDAATSQHGPRQPSPYIFRPNGDLVWSGYGYFSIWAANFQAARVNGQDVLFNFEGDHNALYGHGHGHVTFLDGQYETVRELRAGGHRLMDKHEFHVVAERTGLVQIYHPVPRDLRPWGGSEEQQWIVNALIQGEYSESLPWVLMGQANRVQSSTSKPVSCSSNGRVLIMSRLTVSPASDIHVKQLTTDQQTNYPV
jgi:hypothetical protein